MEEQLRRELQMEKEALEAHTLTRDTLPLAILFRQLLSLLVEGFF
jgi:hypothetical protein